MFRLIPAENVIEKLEMGFMDSTVEDIKRCIKQEAKKLKAIKVLKIRLKTTYIYEIPLIQLIELGKSMTHFPKVTIKCNRIVVVHYSQDLS